MNEVKTYKNAELAKEDFSTAKLPPIRKDFIAQLENALMFLDYKNSDMYHSEAKKQININTFNGAWLTDVSLRHECDDDFMLKPLGELQVTPDMFPNINMKIMSMSGDVAYLSKIRALNGKERRGLKAYRYILSHRVGFLDYGKQKWWTDERGFGFNGVRQSQKGEIIMSPVPMSIERGYVFSDSEIKGWLNEELKTESSSYKLSLRDIHVAYQLALTYEYEWSCYIRENENSIGVRIPIHPSSSKEVFLLRNIEKNKRKKAIINFVKDHYRKVKNVKGEDTSILIKKHLRGDLKFNWRGLEVHITPSPHDLKKYASKKVMSNVIKLD